jgi:hypothetical protein
MAILSQLAILHHGWPSSLDEPSEWGRSPMSWARAKPKPISSDEPSSANSNAVSESWSGGLTGAIMSKSERHWLHREKLHAQPQQSSGMAAVPERGLKHRGHGCGQHDFPELASPLPSGAFSARSRRIIPRPQQRMCYEAEQSSAVLC